MRNATLTFLGALLIAGSTADMATASGHHTHAGRGHHRWERTYDQSKGPSFAAPQMRESYDDGKPPPNASRTCDIKWCYAD